jgi:hypothetical protein
MADTSTPVLDQGTYEILRARLASHGADLRARLDKLNTARQEVFGAIATSLLTTERLTTKNNCTPRDIIPIGGNRFLFGYNVHIGLRTETRLDDVFRVYDIAIGSSTRPASTRSAIRSSRRISPASTSITRTRCWRSSRVSGRTSSWSSASARASRTSRPSNGCRKASG